MPNSKYACTEHQSMTLYKSVELSVVLLGQGCAF